MDESKANPREHQRQVIDAEIKSLEEATRESIRALRHRRNALAPVSPLPTEIIAAIFSLVRLPRTPRHDEKPDHHLAWLHVAHVCHRWREIALDLPHFWSHVDFTNLTLAGAAEILARAKEVPLYLEARLPSSHPKDAWFRAFETELQTRLSYICRLTISAEPFHLRRTLEGLESPAPVLEYLSLSQSSEPWLRTSVPDTLFDCTTPRLSYLKLCHCDISWKSPLFKGLITLDIRKPSSNARPSIGVWLDTLNEMPQLKRLILHSASPSAARLQSDVERTVTLPSLIHLNLSDSAMDCALALAHLVLPALTSLYITTFSVASHLAEQRILQYTAQHAHGSQDTRPLQSVFIRGKKSRVDILAWTVPDIEIEMGDPHALYTAIPSARVVLSFANVRSVFQYQIIDAAMAALPLNSLVALTADHNTQLDGQFWLRHAQQWPLLQRVRLPLPAAHGFRETILKDNGGPENQLFPSLTRLDLINVSLTARRTLRLCDALMKRVEQGVPLETLDLHTCVGTSDAVRLLREIVVDVWDPTESFEVEVGRVCSWDSAARGLFIHDYDDSGKEDYPDDDSKDDSYTFDDDEGGR